MSIEAKLASQFNGELIGPDDSAYEEARKLFNGSIDKRPALIARCTSTSDVQSALGWAREHDLVVEVPAARLLRRREVRAARGAEGRVRPRQRLLAQPEHPAEPAGGLGRLN